MANTAQNPPFQGHYMNDEDIIQEPSPLEVICVKVNRDVFVHNKEFYKKVKQWLRKEYPGVFVIDRKPDKELDDLDTFFLNVPSNYHIEIYFKDRELYLTFIKEFPEVLRGADET